VSLTFPQKSPMRSWHKIPGAKDPYKYRAVLAKQSFKNRVLFAKKPNEIVAQGTWGKPTLQT